MPTTATSASILTFEQARHLVEEHAATLRPRGSELVELLDSPGQVLAEPVLADRNFPPFPRATRDGYAVRAADLAKLPGHVSKSSVKSKRAPRWMRFPGSSPVRRRPS